MDHYLADVASAYPALSATDAYRTAKTLTAQMSQPVTSPPNAVALAQVQRRLITLGDALGQLATTAAKTLPEAKFRPPNASASQSELSPQLAQMAQELSAAAADMDALAKRVHGEMPDATLVPETSLPGGGGQKLRQALGAGFVQLAAALHDLSRETAKALPNAVYVPPEAAGSAAAKKTRQKLQTDVTSFQAALRPLGEEFAGRKDNFFIPTALAGDDKRLDTLLQTYISSDGRAARLQVVLADEPYAPAALDTVSRVREKVGEGKNPVYVSGSEAILLDLQNVMKQDNRRVMVLVLGGIAIVLILLLRSLVAPIYLLATILLSYGATLGLTRLLFGAILHKDLTWWVPFFMFVLLVALGMDYNIFLMGRVKEEAAHLPNREAVAEAVRRTGGIITSAGIIMAGTFAAMMSSSLLGLVQLAFAITMGVLLDTFIVRTTLVPSLVVFFGRWNWWPSKPPKGDKAKPRS